MKALTYIEHGKFALLDKSKSVILNPRDASVWMTVNVETFCDEQNPVTRKPENSNAYNRNKAREWKHECEPTSGFVISFSCEDSVPFLQSGAKRM